MAPELEMRFLAPVLALFSLGCTEGPSPQERSLIAEVEKYVKLPRGAGELRCYRRYYTIVRGRQLEEILGGPDRLPDSELLVGIYREPSPHESPGVEWASSLADVPEVYDGGCANMTVWYAAGWPQGEVKAICSLDISGSIPEEIRGRPLTC